MHLLIQYPGRPWIRVMRDENFKQRKSCSLGRSTCYCSGLDFRLDSSLLDNPAICYRLPVTLASSRTNTNLALFSYIFWGYFLLRYGITGLLLAGYFLTLVSGPPEEGNAKIVSRRLHGVYQDCMTSQFPLQLQSDVFGDVPRQSLGYCSNRYSGSESFEMKYVVG